MSFLPSYITSTLLPPLPAHLLPGSSSGDPKLVVRVTPLRPSSFAGETFQAQIDFSLEQPCAPANEKEQLGEAAEAQATGNLLRRPSAPATPTPSGSLGGPDDASNNFRRTHRSAQSLSNPYIPSLQPPGGSALSPLRSVSASDAQRKVASSLPAGHPHARKPSFAPLQNGSEGAGAFSAEEVPTMTSLRHTSAGSAATKSPMTSLSSILEGDPSRSIAEAEGEDAVLSDSLLLSTPSSSTPSRAPPPAAQSSPSTPSRSNGHRHRSSISLGHGPPPTSSLSGTPTSSRNLRTRLEPSSGLTISWSHVQLQATLTPSPQHFPPESLLPLRQVLLESSTYGSGSLPTSSTSVFTASSSDPSSSSTGWFSLPPPPRHARAPSLTSSLFGIAKTMWSGAGVENTGSLEEERRRMWERTVKEIPVFETLKSICGVGMDLKGSATATSPSDPLNFTYSVKLPSDLPPTFKGKALKISYSLVISIEIEYPLPPARPGYDNESGSRKRRAKAMTLKVPLNVWGGIDEPTTKRGYDLMRPYIQRTQTASLEKAQLTPRSAAQPSSDGAKEKHHLASSVLPATRDSFLSYAAHLFSALPPREPPPESSNTSTPDRREKHRHTRSQALSPSTFIQSLPEVHINGSAPGARAEDELQRARRMERLASLDHLDEKGGEDVVDGLLRASKKASYDIEKEGQVVAVLTLVKSAFRLGETVSGVVAFNEPSCLRRVLKFSAYLITHEVVPASLHAPNGPKLKPFVRTHAEYHASLTPQTSRLSFSLDMNTPGPTLGNTVSPSFGLVAGEADKTAARRGGLQWKVHVSFLVSAPSRSKPTSVEVLGQSAPGHLLAVSPLSTEEDATHESFRPTPSIAPVVELSVKDANGHTGTIMQEMRTEVVECDIDVAMFAPSRLGLAALNIGEEGVQEEGTVTFVI